MRHYELVRAMGLLAILVSCGGDGGSGGKTTESTDQTLCTRICERSTAAKCDNDAPNCVSECKKQIASTPSACKKSERAFTACAEKAKFSCDITDQAEAKACQTQLDAYATCLGEQSTDGDAGDDEARHDDDDDDEARHDDDGTSDAGGTIRVDAGTTGRCEPASNDDACDTCLKTRCCGEVKACGAPCIAVVDCATECGPDADCIRGCVEANPAGIQAYIALTSCMQEEQECLTACAGTSN